MRFLWHHKKTPQTNFFESFFVIEITKIVPSDILQEFRSEFGTFQMNEVSYVSNSFWKSSWLRLIAALLAYSAQMLLKTHKILEEIKMGRSIKPIILE